MNHPSDQLPVRKKLAHVPPFRVVTDMSPVFFVTICAHPRTGSPFLTRAMEILSAARNYQAMGKWFLHLFLIMPEHLHFLAQFHSNDDMARTVGNWKRYLCRTHGLSFQMNFFETRIRDQNHFNEKWHYILYNPVRRNLVPRPRDWPHVISFNPATGQERVHRGMRPETAAPSA